MPDGLRAQLDRTDGAALPRRITNVRRAVTGANPVTSIRSLRAGRPALAVSST
jgi:hypothetical protein